NGYPKFPFYPKRNVQLRGFGTRYSSRREVESMALLGDVAYLRSCTEADDACVYDVFCTTWESEVAALPNQNLAQHVLRIQHIAQERRFASQYPDLQRYIVVQDGEPAGRPYSHETAPPPDAG